MHMLEEPGSGTFTIPDGITEITVQAIGAGGGGGYTSRSTTNPGTGGGGGGAYAERKFDVNPNDVYFYTVGDGGISNNSPTDYEHGEDSQFILNNADEPTVKAHGGRTVPNNISDKGIGGSSEYPNSIGELVFSGGNGGDGRSGYGGGGGGAAGTSGSGQSANYNLGGVITENFGGSGASVARYANSGNAGYKYGGGGSGARGWDGAGGKGAAGLVRISYVPAYRAEFVTMDLISPIWELNETREILLTVKNTGQATWSDSNPDINIGVKWDDDSDYFYYADANYIESGDTRTYSITVTAPGIIGENHLSFDVYNVSGFNFADNDIDLAVEGNSIFQSETLSIVHSATKFYSYKSGNWNDPTTWTHDPSGITQFCVTTPDDYSEVYILSNGKVNLTGNVSEENLKINIANGGLLDMGNYKFNSPLASLRGEGTLRLSSANFPQLFSDYEFVKAEGGTVEYYNSNNLALSNLQEEYNNLIISAGSSVTVNQLHDLKINGNFYIKSGTYKISEDSNTNDVERLALIVDGDILVKKNASLLVGTKRTTTASFAANITNDGNLAPFIDYYNNHTHKIVLKGNIENNGTIRFTNMPHPIYDKFPTTNGETGMATVYFQGYNNSELICNGTTDFYNLVLDKGEDQTYKLTVYSSDYYNFRLFGANSFYGYDGGVNPQLRKALWIRIGTLELTGRTVIPSLTEGKTTYNVGSPNSNFYIPAKGALVLNGSDVIVLGTADSYEEINAAYGLSGGSNSEYGVLQGSSSYYQNFTIYGKLQIDDGYFSTRQCNGIYGTNGNFEINGGIVDAQSIVDKINYKQTGGIVELRGRFRREVSSITLESKPEDLRLIGSESIGNNSPQFDQAAIYLDSNSSFFMSGGYLKICGSGNSGTVRIESNIKNIDVSGGTVELNQAGIIISSAPFYNLIVKTAKQSENRIDNYNLEVLNDLIVISGELKLHKVQLILHKDFFIEKDGTYTYHTNSTSVNTNFVGDKDQLFSCNGSLGTGLYNVFIDKEGGEVRLHGELENFIINNNFEIRKGIFNDGGKNVFVKGPNILNSGLHIGTGSIVLEGTATQSVSGNGNGVFNNLTLNNNFSVIVNVTFKTNLTINGTLTFQKDKGVNIGANNLKMGVDASFCENAGLGNRFFRTTGNLDDGGLTLTYNKAETKLFPFGVDNIYTPASIGFTDEIDSYGTITIVSANTKHYTIKNDNALKCFWRVKSSDFSGYSGKVTHSFSFDESHWGGDVALYNIYVPAALTSNDYSWKQGESSNLDVLKRTISDWRMPTQSSNILDADYTAGVPEAFVEKTIYYSRTSGNWNESSTWSTSNHSGGSASNYPTESDFVIIGKGHTVTLTENAYSTYLQIEEGGVLDVKTFGESNFSVALSHNSGKNGTIKATVENVNNSIFNFPKGDFTDFNENLGTTEFYVDGGTNVTYYLPTYVNNYGNLILNPVVNSKIIFGNTNVTIYGDLIHRGFNSSNTYFNIKTYPTGHNSTTPIKKIITVLGNFNIERGVVNYANEVNFINEIIVHNDIVISKDGQFKTADSFFKPLKIGGSLINNSTADFTGCTVTFFSEKTAYITNDDKTVTPTTKFNSLILDKGTSQLPELIIDIDGTLSLSKPAFTFINGTVVYKRNTSQDVSISSGAPFTLPETAGLWVESSGTGRVIISESRNSTGTSGNLFSLKGKITLISGTILVQEQSPKVYKEISYKGPNAALEIHGGEFIVGRIYRDLYEEDSSVLSYVQTGGNVIIKTGVGLEIAGLGSRFDMSAGTLTFEKGLNNISSKDLILKPDYSSVTGGDIIFAHNETTAQTYNIDVDIPLNNFIVTGNSEIGKERDAKVVATSSEPFIIKGDLTLSNANSILDMGVGSNTPLVVKGDFINNGVYNHHKNLTTFDGGVQSIIGSGQTSFYDLKINSITSLTIDKDVDIENDLVISRGNFVLNKYTAKVGRNFINNSAYKSGDSAGGILLSNRKIQHLISGTGTFERLELNNVYGAKALSNITMSKNFILTNGVFDINKHLFSLGEGVEIEGVNFGFLRMISTDGVYRSKGIQKLFSNINSQRTFTYPIGVKKKYTPVHLNIDSNSQPGFIRINGVDEKHPSSISPFKVLDYYWDVESIGISDFTGSFEFEYDENDVLQNVGDDLDYIAARLVMPEAVWEKAGLGNSVDATSNIIRFEFTNSDNLNGEYTAGEDDSIQDFIPTYSTNKSGNWSDASIWSSLPGMSPCPDGGPVGAIVIIEKEHEVTLDKNYISSYLTTINGKLKVDKTKYGHNLGFVNGVGTLYLEESILPAGRFDNFLDPYGNGTVEFGGYDDYSIDNPLFTELSNMIISGSGSRILHSVPFTIHNSLIIDGGTLDNSVNNQKLIIKGSLSRINGGKFISGSGKNATVVFDGILQQEVGNFTGSNSFNNLEINNESGLVLIGNVEIKNQLKLTKGIIYSSETSMLKITNPLLLNTVLPEGGHIDSYVDGPMSKRINDGDSFIYPIGKDGVLGNKFLLSATQGGVEDWVVEYFNPNYNYIDFDEPLTYVNANDKWVIQANSGKQAKFGVLWDAKSILMPLVEYGGNPDLQLAKYDADDINSWKILEATASGIRAAGVINSNERVEIPASGEIQITSATINSVHAKAKMIPDVSFCSETVGIPISFTSSYPINSPYNLKYSINSVEQPEVTINESDLPYILPTYVAGEYQLLTFTHSNGKNGVVDDVPIMVYTQPTEANAGSNQSLCGASSTILNANEATHGVGLWTIIDGIGGSFEDPTKHNSAFSGPFGSAFILRWTIINGECESFDDVKISFPLEAVKPVEFVAYQDVVCSGSKNVVYSVPRDITADYYWEYSGSGVTINGSGNSVRLSFAFDATEGNLSVKAVNGCKESESITKYISVKPVESITLETDFDKELCLNNMATFIVNPSAGLWSYNFLVDDVSVKSGLENIFVTSGLTNGNRVKVLATAQNGCVVEFDEIPIKISKTPGIWTGAVDSEIENKGNWCNGNLPRSYEDIVVNKGINSLAITGNRKFGSLRVNNEATAILMPGSSLDLTNILFVEPDGEFILQSNFNKNGLSSLNTLGSVIGQTKIRLTLPTNQWYYLSSPMNRPQTSYFGVGNIDGIYAYRYSTSKEWLLQTDSDVNITNGEGMSVYCVSSSDNEVTLEYDGQLNTGEITVRYSSKNFYLFGNPFPTSLNWQDESLYRNRIAGTIWYRTRANSEMVFVTYNRYAQKGARVAVYPEEDAINNEEELALIPPYQSVWVYTRTASEADPAVIRVNNQQKVHTQGGATLKSSSSTKNTDIIRIVSQNNKSRDGAVIYFSENSQDGLDAGDSEKYFNSSENIPEIYTRIEKEAFSINGLAPFEGSYEVPLSVRNRVVGEVELKFDLSLYRSDDIIVLYDSYEEKMINLRKQDVYKYIPKSLGDNHNRFSILINPEGYKVEQDPQIFIEDTELSQISIKQVGEKICITIPQYLLLKGDGNIFIYDIKGTQLAEYIATKEKMYIDLPNERGTFIVTVIVGNEQKSNKFIK